MEPYGSSPYSQEPATSILIQINPVHTLQSLSFNQVQ
jgi:hypothetical protein